MVYGMNKLTTSTLKKNKLLNWLYKQKNDVSVNDLIKFIESNTQDQNTVEIKQKDKTNH
jgi:hypothetical protein